MPNNKKKGKGGGKAKAAAARTANKDDLDGIDDLLRCAISVNSRHIVVSTLLYHGRLSRVHDQSVSAENRLYMYSGTMHCVDVPLHIPDTVTHPRDIILLRP